MAPTRHCLILGDFNTPPNASGYDAWRVDFNLANEAQARGFQETWAYGAPALTLDQLWLSKDLRSDGVTQQPGLASDHCRITFHVSEAR